MSEVNPNYNPQADFDNFGKEMEHIIKTTPKEVLKEEWDKVLAEYGTDMYDKILSMTDEFIQSNRSEGQFYSSYHHDMMADFALHILEALNTKKMKTMKELLNEFRTWQKEWDTTHKGMNAEDFCASLEEKYEVINKNDVRDLISAAYSTLQRLYELTESREAKEQIDSAMTYLNRATFNTKEK